MDDSTKVDKEFTLDLDSYNKFKTLNFSTVNGDSFVDSSVGASQVNNYPDSKLEAVYGNDDSVDLSDFKYWKFVYIGGKKLFVTYYDIELSVSNPCPYFDGAGNILSAGINIGYVGVEYFSKTTIKIISYVDGGVVHILKGIDLYEQAVQDLNKKLQDWISQCEKFQQYNSVINNYDNLNNLQGVNLYTTSSENNKSFVYNKDKQIYEIKGLLKKQ
jgi:hypothetical protein